MKRVSWWGDWPPHIVAALLGAVIASALGSRRWIMICAAMVIACALAGTVNRAVKIASGRARPTVTEDAGWNGPRFGSKYNSFPSGHTAATVAVFGTLFLARRRVGILLLPIPLLIALSRIYLNAHHFSDVIGGALDRRAGCAGDVAIHLPEHARYAFARGQTGAVSDIGLFPAGAAVWLCSLVWCGVCLLALVIFLLVAWLRTRKGVRGFTRDRFIGYAVGVWASGMMAAVSMGAISWSGSLGAFSHWIDGSVTTIVWMAATVLVGPVVGYGWNRARRELESDCGTFKSLDPRAR